MKRKHLYVILAALLVGLALYAPSLVRERERPSEPPEDVLGLGEGLARDATEIRVHPPDEEEPIVLRRRAGGWTVNGRAADDDAVEELLAALDTLRGGRVVARDPDNHARLGVTEATARRVEVHTAEDEPAVFLLGRRASGGGTYVRRPDADEVHLLEGPAGGLLGRTAEGWRRREIATVDTSAVREVVIHREGEEFTIARREGSWWVDGSAADGSAVRELLTTLSGLRATGFPPDSVEEAADFGEPTGVLSVFSEGATDVTGRNLTVSLRFVRGAEEGDPWLVRRADAGSAFEIPDATAGRLLPAQDSLLAGG